MKRHIILFACVATLLTTACHKPQDKNIELKNHQDSTSWAFGTSVGIAVRDCGLELNKEMVLAAVEQALNNGKQPLDQQTYEDLLAEANMQLAAARRGEVTTARSEEEAYFAKLVKENPNVKRAEQGFYYEVVKSGNGKNVVFSQRIEFDYKSYFMLSGELFDQTYGNRSPIVTNVAEHMFPGLVYGFMLMNKGSIYRFYFPSHLAFGEQGNDDIPPHTPLIYEIELHDIYED